MDIGLLIIASVPDVTAVPSLSQPAQARSLRGYGPEPSDHAAAVNGPQGLTPDNRSTDAPKQAAAEPAQDFSQVLEKQMKSKGPQEECNPARPEAKAPSPDTTPAPNGVAASQSPCASPDASPTVPVAPGKTAAQSADSPQPREATKTAKQAAPLTDGSSVSGLANLTANVADTTSKTAVKQSPTAPDSAPKPAKSAVSQGQTESKTLLPNLPEHPPEPAAQSQEGPQLRQMPAPAANKAPVAQEGAAAEADTTRRLPPEFLAKDGTKAVPAEKSVDLVKQNVSNTVTAQDNQELLKEGASDAKSGPKTSGATLPKPDGRADSGPNTQTFSDSPNGSGREGGLGEKTLTGESLLQRLNATLVQTATSQAKTRDNKASDGSLVQGSEQITARNSPRIALGEQPSNASQDARAAGNASSANVSASVSEQIQESLRTSLARPDQQITIRLNPPELGTVLIKFREQDSQITGILEVNKSQTRAEIQQALPEIVRNLQELGVNIRRLEVVLTNGQERQALNGESASPHQDNWPGWQGYQNPNTQAGNGGATDLFVNEGSYAEFIGRNEAFITDKSIDMFV
jgi:flagellar hook-length control protein FliK